MHSIDLPNESNIAVAKPVDQNKKPSNKGFIAAFKAKALEELVKNKEDSDAGDKFEDLYLDKDQKKILQSTKWLIRGHSKCKLRWDLLIMVLAIINWFSIPIEVAFEPPALRSVPAHFINMIIDILFFADLLVNFRTTFIHSKTGNEVLSTKEISISYLKGRFWIDFIAILPVDYLGEIIFGAGNATLLRSISLLKLVRVLRLNKIISIMKVANEIKLSLKLVKLIFFLVMYLHWSACTFYFLVTLNRDWLPPMDYVWVGTEFYEWSLEMQYCSSMYHAVLLLTGNDVGPRGYAQLIFASWSITLGAIINANIFGELAVILATMNRNAAVFQAKLDVANAAMKNLSLPEKLQVQVSGFLTYSKSLLESQEELEAFLQMISPSLRQKVLKHIFNDVLHKNPVLCKNTYLIEFVIKNLNTNIFLPEYSVVTQGEKGDSMYFISKGEWEVTVTDHKGVKSNPPALKDGDLFGEIALMLNCNRTATVKTKIYSLIASLRRNEFDTVWRLFYVFYSKLKEKMKSYNDSYKVFLKQLIRSVDYMSKLCEDSVEEISYYLKQEDYEKDKIIFRAGDSVNNVYFITNGRVNITINVSETDISIDTLYRGCWIGSNGIIYNSNFSFTARAETKVTILKLSKEDFKTLINSCDDLDKEVFSLKEYYYNTEKPYSDFRVFRDPENEFTIKDIAKLSVTRLLRINRNLIKYKSADEIIILLKRLQNKYNSGVDLPEGHNAQCAETQRLVHELFEYIRRNQSNCQHHSTQSSLLKESRDICLQANPKEIVGMIPSKNVKLPSIFSPGRKGESKFDRDEVLSLYDLTSENESSQS